MKSRINPFCAEKDIVKLKNPTKIIAIWRGLSQINYYLDRIFYKIQNKNQSYKNIIESLLTEEFF